MSTNVTSKKFYDFPDDPVGKLVAQVDTLFEGKDENQCKDALLTLVTYMIADIGNVEICNEYIDKMCVALKESVLRCLNEHDEASNILQ